MKKYLKKLIVFLTNNEINILSITKQTKNQRRLTPKIMPEKEVIEIKDIKNKIYTIRGNQVMLDRDLAVFYDVETRTLNQAVKRNIQRFPYEFCFQLTKEEYHNWISQFVISNFNKMGLRRAPYAFTEQGVAMLSTILKSKVAVKVSVQIMNAFVTMRRFMLSNAQVFQRLDSLEIKQIATDKKIDEVFNAIESKTIQPKQGIFFDGQVFDAYQFVSQIIRSAKKSIILIDNYVDDTTLTQFTKKKSNVKLIIYTKKIRRIWYEEDWYYSVVDIIAALTESPTPRQYWEKIKQREFIKLQLSPIWGQLKLESADGKKYATDCVNTKKQFP